MRKRKGRRWRRKRKYSKCQGESLQWCL